MTGSMDGKWCAVDIPKESSCGLLLIGQVLSRSGGGALGNTGRRRR